MCELERSSRHAQGEGAAGGEAVRRQRRRLPGSRRVVGGKRQPQRAAVVRVVGGPRAEAVAAGRRRRRRERQVKVGVAEVNRRTRAPGEARGEARAGSAHAHCTGLAHAPTHPSTPASPAGAAHLSCSSPPLFCP